MGAGSRIKLESEKQLSKSKDIKIIAEFPFFVILGLIFITLKLTGHITWSWWLVLLPLYGPLAVVLGLFLVGFIIGLIVLGVTALFAKSIK